MPSRRGHPFVAMAFLMFDSDLSVGDLVIKILNTGYFIDVFQFLEVGTDGVHIVHVVYEQLDAPFKDAVVRFDVQVVDVQAQLL